MGIGYNRDVTDTNSSIVHKFSYIDLFSGAGGLSLGFQKAGYKCIRAFDNNKAAVSTYQENFHNHISEADITESIVLDNVDVIIGGPPCQGFSSAGMRRVDDKRSTLVQVFSELLVSYRPKAFVFENVEGFLTIDKGKQVFDLLDPLIEAGYRIHLRKINAANYGIPQHRKRVIAIGGLGWDPEFPEPTHMAYGAPGASKVFRHLPRCPTIREAIINLPGPQTNPPGIPQGHFLKNISDTDKKRMALLKPGQTMKDLPKELWHSSYKRRANRRVKDGTPTERRGGAPFGLRRLNENQPSKAITSGAISELIHPLENRYLTIRECARLQTFPDDFVFTGTTSQMILQIGNAVPPRLAEAIAFSLLKGLQQLTPTMLSRDGDLLSFVPTHSKGMSPVLQSVTQRIEDEYFSDNSIEVEQLKLWA